MRYLGIALLTLATLAAASPAQASEALAPDVSFRLGSALLAGDPVDTDLLAGAAASTLTDEAPQQQAVEANGADQSFSPYFKTAVPSDDMTDSVTYRLVAGVGCTIDEKTTLDVALDGTLEDEDNMQEAVMEALDGDFDDHRISLGVTMTF